MLLYSDELSGTSKNSPFAICANLLPHLCLMKIPQYTKYSGISITLSESKSLSQIIKKEFLEVAYRLAVLARERLKASPGGKLAKIYDF